MSARPPASWVSLAVTAGERGPHLTEHFGQAVLEMCRVAERVSGCCYRSPEKETVNCLRKSRRVVRKYRRMSLRREMRRLRQMLGYRRDTVEDTVLEGAVQLINSLEEQLLARLREVGLPPRLANTGLDNNKMGINDLREAVGKMMANAR